MSEPKNVRDLKWMCDTSSGWFDGRIKYEQIKKPDEPLVEGVAESESVHVLVYGDTVAVERRLSVICEVRSEYSYITKTANCSRTEYSFKGFRESEWWPVCMEAWKGGMTDSSWLDDVRFNDYGNDVSLRMMVSSTYTDYLGNCRQSKDVRVLCIHVEKSSGLIVFSANDKEVSFTLDELLEMVETAKLMKDNGVFVDAGSVRIEFGEGDT